MTCSRFSLGVGSADLRCRERRPPGKDPAHTDTLGSARGVTAPRGNADSQGHRSGHARSTRPEGEQGEPQQQGQQVDEQAIRHRTRVHPPRAGLVGLAAVAHRNRPDACACRLRDRLARTGDDHRPEALAEGPERSGTHHGTRTGHPPRHRIPGHPRRWNPPAANDHDAHNA